MHELGGAQLPVGNVEQPDTSHRSAVAEVDVGGARPLLIALVIQAVGYSELAPLAGGQVPGVVTFHWLYPEA